MADPQQVKQEQIVRLAPFQEKYLADIFASAGALTGDGSQMPYSAQQLAGLTDQQKTALQSATQGVGAYQPDKQDKQVLALLHIRNIWIRTWNL